MARPTTHQIVNIIFSIILKGQSQNHKGCAKQCYDKSKKRDNVNHVLVVSCQFKFWASLNYLVELVSELRSFERACVLDVVFHILKFHLGQHCWRLGRDFARFLQTMLALESH